MDNTSVKTEVPSGFLHDGEHPKVSLPFVVRVEDRQLRGTSLSVIDFVATGLMPQQDTSSTVPVTLRFDFEGFSVSLFAEAHANVARATEDPEVHFTFDHPTGSHLAALRYIINSYISGDLVSMSGLLNYNGPISVKTKANGSREPQSFVQKVMGWTRRAGVAAASLGLIYLAGTVVQRHVVYGFDPRPVLVTQEGTTIRATAAGQITFADETAGEGTVLYSITSNSGDFLSVKMPCNCDVVAYSNFAVGATVLAGTPLLKLVEDGARPTAETEISFESSNRVAAGDQSALVFANGDVVPVTVALQPDQNSAAEGMKATVNFYDPVAAEKYMGKTAQLRFQKKLPFEGLANNALDLLRQKMTL